MSALAEADVRLLAGWLGPEYFLEAARAAGKGDAVLGAPAAAREVRALIRRYLRFLGRPPAESADLLRALGWIGIPPLLVPLEQTFTRQLLGAWWPKGEGQIPGWVEILVDPGASLHELERRFVLALCELSSHEALRRVWLEGRVWFHVTTPPVLVVSRVPGSREKTLIPVRATTEAEVARALVRGQRAAARRDSHALRSVGEQVALQWARHAPIWSPAVFTVSLVGKLGVEAGWAALPPIGVACAATIGKVHRGRVTVSLAIDHRAWDGEEAGIAYEFLASRVGGP